MPRVLIVDDERLARRELRELLGHIPGVEVSGEAGSAAEARAILARTQIHIVFLDIKLGSGSGFELVPALPEDCALVFVTAYDEFALRAFESNAVDYLLKPVEPARLRRVIERVQLRAHQVAPECRSQSSGRLSESGWLFLPVDERRVFVKLRDITHLTANGDYVNVHTADGRSISTSTSLAHWEARLPASFLRVHRQTIVNLEFVTNLEPWSHYSYQVSLRGVRHPVSMSRRYALRARELLG